MEIYETPFRRGVDLVRAHVREPAAEMTRLVAKLAVVLWVVLVLAMAAFTTVLSPGVDSLDGIQIAALCSVIVGATLTMKVPSNAVGPLALIGGSAWIVYRFGNAYAIASLTTELPGAYLLGWIGAWIGALFPLGLAALILCFPTGRPVGWWRAVLAGPMVGVVATLIGAVALWGLSLSTLVDDDRLTEIPGYSFVDIGFLLGFFSALPATMSVLARYRRAETVERLQIKWLMTSTTIFAIGFVLTVVIDDTNDNLWWALSIALAAIPISILLAVLRYHLYEIDRIVSRTISYLVVVGLLAAVFIGVVTAVGSLLQTESDLAIAASTLAVAALFNPLRKRVQTWVDRRFNRSRYDAQRVMDGFAGSLRNRVDTEEVVRGWVGVVSETMQPAAVGVWVRES